MSKKAVGSIIVIALILVAGMSFKGTASNASSVVGNFLGSIAGELTGGADNGVLKNAIGDLFNTKTTP